MPKRIQRKRTKGYNAARNKAWRDSTTRPKATCHPDRYHRARGLCDRCYDRWLYANSPTHKENRRRSAIDWASRHPERKKRSDDAARIKRRYGLTLDQVAALSIKQCGACPLCRSTPGSLSIDHCHKTGVVRGLLCAPCNRALGFFERFRDDSERQWIARAEAYLEASCQ